mmetsp:Transcript_31/g.81  ORF Transcript_31/g.81 Transcript_31/m.81 type:complete len:179 (-) Transcript_31:107-643(-)
MGWFGGNKVKDESAAKSATRSPNDIENANLPVAVPIHAQVVHTPAAPPPQQPAYQAPPQPTIVQNNNVAASPPIQQLKPYKPNQQPPSMFLNDPVLKRHPMMMRCCPICGQESRTRIITGPNWMTWLACVVLFILCWPFCWVPLVVDAMKLTEHYCVLCNGLVGRVEPMKDCCVRSST